METILTNEKNVTKETKAQKIVRFLNEKRLHLTVLAYYLVAKMNTSVAYADDTTTGEDLWNTAINDFVVPWVQRIGGGVIIFGLIELGLGIKNNDPNKKDTGWMSIAIGGMIFAVGTGAGKFLV